MKLKKTFVTHMVAGEQIMVPVGASAKTLRGFVRSNETAAFIVDCFKNDCTVEDVVNAVLNEYETNPTDAEAAVMYVVDMLKSIDALEE